MQQGRVAVLVTLDATAAVTDATVHESAAGDLLDRAAIDAVMGHRFTPALQRGVQVKRRIVLSFRFALAYAVFHVPRKPGYVVER
jgi:TonB family protein